MRNHLRIGGIRKLFVFLLLLFNIEKKGGNYVSASCAFNSGGQSNLGDPSCWVHREKLNPNQQTNKQKLLKGLRTWTKQWRIPRPGFRNRARLREVILERSCFAPFPERSNDHAIVLMPQEATMTGSPRLVPVSPTLSWCSRSRGRWMGIWSRGLLIPGIQWRKYKFLLEKQYHYPRPQITSTRNFANIRFRA